MNSFRSRRRRRRRKIKRLERRIEGRRRKIDPSLEKNERGRGERRGENQDLTPTK